MNDILYRRNTVREALIGSRRSLVRLWVQQGLPRKEINPLLQLARKKHIPISEVSKQKLGNLTQVKSHQGVALEASPFVYAHVDEMLALAEDLGEKPLLLLLDLVQGPNNIGALLRSAELCGVHGIIMQDRRAPDITPSIVASAVGATEHLLIAQVTNLTTTINQLQNAGIWIVGMDIGDESRPIDSLDLDMPLGVIVGFEGSGMRRRVRESCDLLLRLPMRGHVDSYNAAVAGSIMLYTAWQARGFPGRQ